VASELYRKARRLAEEHGCEFVRQGKGDHEIWWSPITNQKFTLDKGSKKRHTINGALRDAGIDEKV
jgi:hypothetical protein